MQLTQHGVCMSTQILCNTLSTYVSHYPSVTYSRLSPGVKAVGEDVPMDDNPAYGEVNIYDTVEEQKEIISK